MVPFSVEVERDGVIQLDGELDLAGLRSLRAALASVEGTVVFDCSRLTFVDASGLGVLLEAIERCQARGVTCTIAHPPRCLTWLLELLDLDVPLSDTPSSVANASLAVAGTVLL